MGTFSAGRRALVAALIAAAVAAPRASSPKFFQSATQADFLKGDLENLAVDGRGQLTLGPATELVYETPSPFLWTVLAGADGTVYAGTGNDGRVYRVDAQGLGSLWFDSNELEVHALAPAPDGGLYAATSPGGRIYRINQAGKATPFFDPGEKYIWALAVDDRGVVYAGTGEKGIVYRIQPDGKGAIFYQTKATHATALALDKSGTLFVGTETPARVLRVGADGKGFMLLDTPYQEIRTLRFDDKGSLLVAAVNGRAASLAAPNVPSDAGATPSAAETGRAPVPSVSVSTEITAVGGIDTTGATPAPSPRSENRNVKGAVYRIAPDGLWDQVWESRDDSPYDVALDAEGRVVIATGSKGKIYRLEGTPPQPVLVARAGAQQVTALYRDPRGGLSYATANPGKLFRLSQARATSGTYESEIRDAQMVSSWGRLSWRGTVATGHRLDLSTRSGNTETPDDTWSAWSAPYTSPEGSPITSPKARFIQWRAVLSGSASGSPTLTSVTAAYLQRNLRPQVRSVTVHPPGIVFQKPYGTSDPDLAGFDNQTTPERRLVQAAQAQGGSASSLGRRTFQKGLQTLAWRADDENDDQLSYEVQYRREGDTAWKVLRRDLLEPLLVWDTATIPNGTYFVKIIASDAPSNAAGTALTGDMESAAFEVDNTPPRISIGPVRVEGARTLVAFDVNDDHSPIQRVEFSEDGLTWRSVFPADGIADSKAEHYELAIEGAIGARGITLRVSDAMHNVATAQVAPPRTR
jgi:hypothetical protein